MRRLFNLYSCALTITALSLPGCTTFPSDTPNLNLSVRTVTATNAHFGHSLVHFTLGIEATLENISRFPIKVFPDYQDVFQYEHIGPTIITTVPLPPYKYREGLTLKPNERFSFLVPVGPCFAKCGEAKSNSCSIPFEIRYNYHAGRSEFAHCVVKVEAESR